MLRSGEVLILAFDMPNKRCKQYVSDKGEVRVRVRAVFRITAALQKHGKVLLLELYGLPAALE